MTNIISTLNEKLLEQAFGEDQSDGDTLSHYQNIAYSYSKIENSIAVLSDLKSNRSYIYYGGIAETLGLSTKGDNNEINSIWEEEIFSRIHPDDLAAKHMLELHFFHLLKKLPSEKRLDYCIISKMRMLNNRDEYVTIQHRMFYVSSCNAENLWLALCLYGYYPYKENTQDITNGVIMNSITGEIIKPENIKNKDILSQREIEILQLIEKGKMSKEIANNLSISINTVNRHRQNILEKLRVKNSIEACRIGKLMELF